MGFWQRIIAPWTKSSIEEWWGEFATNSRSNSGISINAQTAMRSTVVMACVRVLSQDVAKLPPHIYRRLPDGSRVELKQHFLYKLFRRPNSWQTWFEFAEMLQVGLALRGNGLAAVKRDGRGVPVELIPINPDRMSIYEADNGFYFYNVARFGQFETWALRDFPQLIPADDIFHLRWAGGQSSLVGMSPISYAREAIGYSLALEMHGANISGAGARPSGVLTTDRKLSEDAVKRVTASWKRDQAGVANSGGTLVLEQGLKWQALAMNSVDMEFIESRKLQVEEICRIFGVAPAKIGVMDQVGRNFEQIQLAHLTDTVDPNTRRWIDKFHVYFGLADDIEVEFDISQLLRADLAARANAARVLVMSGLAEPNEGRKSLGMDPHEDGDVLLVPANMVPIQMAGVTPGKPAGPGSDQSGSPADGGDGDPAQIPSG